MNSGYDKITLLDKWRLVQKLVSDPGLSRCAVACGFHLIDLYNTRLDRAWPSYDTLARLTGANRRTVITAVKRLLASEYFKVERGSGRRSNYYRPNFSLIFSKPKRSSNGEQDTTTSGASTSPLQGVEVNSTTPNTSYVPVALSVGDIEVSPRSAGSSARRAPSPSRGAPPGFEEFWQAYPRKEGRKAALTAYAKALQGGEVTPELLAAKAAQYAYAKSDQDPKWIKMPRTWLGEECWLEDPQPGAQKRRSEATETSQPDKSTRASRSKTTAKKAKAPPKSKGKSGRPEKQRKPVSVQPNSFATAVPIYCDFLGITLEDLAAATGVSARALKETCAGKARMPNQIKTKLRSLLIEAMLYLPDDRSLSVDELQRYYKECIRDKPRVNYGWRRPDYYKKQRQAQVAPKDSKPRHSTSTTNGTRAADSSGPGVTAHEPTGDAKREGLRPELRATAGEVEANCEHFHDYIKSAIRALKLTMHQAKEMMRAMGIERIRDLDTPEKIAKGKEMIDGFISENASTT